MNYKLTEYSHGAGCGCKLSPGVLSEILGRNKSEKTFEQLIIGNDTKDDAAVVNLDGETAIVSTTDFFMPIVDDPYDFGAIAATNSISDIYAMGAEPIVAIAILGWPIDKIPPEIAGDVLNGARDKCEEAGIPLAGGHSIDAPEPIFGLAVTGKVKVDRVKANNTAKQGDILYLTKPLGIGFVTTAQKKKLADPDDLNTARESMLKLNDIGIKLGQLDYVHFLTDVTGFGIGGHLLEVCEASSLSANLYFDKLPVFDFVEKYVKLKCIPGGTERNWNTYGKSISIQDSESYLTIADPQTSGGLLIGVDPEMHIEFERFMKEYGYDLSPIGELRAKTEKVGIAVL